MNKPKAFDKNNLPYNIDKVFHPLVAVDVLIFTISDDKLKILLVKRAFEPFKDSWAIPGGFINKNESLEESALRELREETGLTEVYLEQLYSFGNIDRDPRGRVISIAYYALIPEEKIGNLKAQTDVSEAKWFAITDLPKLAFDHNKILEYSLLRLRWKMEYTTVVYSLLNEEFTLTELQRIYEIVFSRAFDKRNFRKKILSLDLIEQTGKTVIKGVQRPAKTYRFKKKKLSLVDIT